MKLIKSKTIITITTTAVINELMSIRLIGESTSDLSISTRSIHFIVGTYMDAPATSTPL